MQSTNDLGLSSFHLLYPPTPHPEQHNQPFTREWLQRAAQPSMQDIEPAAAAGGVEDTHSAKASTNHETHEESESDALVPRAGDGAFLSQPDAVVRASKILTPRDKAPAAEVGV